MTKKNTYFCIYLNLKLIDYFYNKMKKLFVILFAVLASICICSASSVEVRSARALYAKRDYVGALEMLKKAIKKDSKDVEALHSLAVLYFEMNDFDNAFKYIDKTIKSAKKNDPNLPVYYGSKAAFCLESHDTVAAWKEYDNAISIDPNQKEVLLDRAILYRKQKEYDKSTAELKKVLVMEPNQQAYTGVGMNEYRKKNYKASVDWYNMSLKNFPTGYYTYILRGKSYLKMKEYGEAVDDALTAMTSNYFEDANNLINEIIDSTAFDTVMSRLIDKAEKEPSELIWKNAIGNLYYNYGKPYDAINTYSSALHTEKSNDYLIYLYIADCYSLTGDFDTALAYCDSAYAVNPKKMRCWHKKMRFYIAMEKYDKALEVADEMIGEAPDSETLLEDRSDIKRLLGDYEGSLKDLEKLLSYQNTVHYLTKKASLLHKMGRQADAEFILNKLLEHEKFVSGSYSKFAYALLGQKDKVRSLCEAEIKKGSGDVYFNIACAYSMMGEYAEGLTYLRKSLEYKSNNIMTVLTDVDIHDYKKLPEFWTLINEFRPKKK